MDTADDPGASPVTTEDKFRALREQMVEQQLRARGISDSRVLVAMKHIPRHHFVPGNLRQVSRQQRRRG